MQVRVHVLVLTAALMPVRALVLFNMEALMPVRALVLFNMEARTADITEVLKGDNLQAVPSFPDGINSKVRNLHLL